MKTLLPSGCYDVLPPLARHDTLISSCLLEVFEAYGYEQVAPPLLEYSDNLLVGRGEALGVRMFRVMDPASNKVMGIRPDITLQIARIAESKLKKTPRPLRLSYNGLILRLQGEQLNTDRQLRQAGIELIGAASPEADSEVIMVAAAALKKLGVENFTIDLNLPALTASMVATDALTEAQAKTLYEAISHKDVATLQNLPLAYKDALITLLTTTGAASEVLPVLERLDLPTNARALCSNLRDVVGVLNNQTNSSWSLTIDATESQGHDYHSGVGFSIFVPGVTYQVGRGGRYMAGEEPATGFTLYVEALRELIKATRSPDKILMVDAASQEEQQNWQDKGYITIQALPGFGSTELQAKKLGCSHILQKGELKKI